MAFSLSFVFFLQLCLIGSAGASAQEVSKESPDQQSSGEALVVEQAPIVADLKSIEEKVKSVVEQNAAATVAITDGIGAGSGIVVSKEGLILTAGHVLVTDRDYDVLFPDGRVATARPLGKNLNVDAGMVKIVDRGDWPVAKIGSSKSLEKGDWLVSLGHSGGFELGRKPPVRTGRLLDRNRYQLMTDAVLIGGDSGGPLFNLDGELVAIHSSIGDSVAENRHVQIEIFERDWERMLRGEIWGRLPELNDPGEKKDPPRIGVRIEKETAIIKTVRLHSPASDVGIEPGDLVTQFDGKPIQNGNELIEMIRSKIVGDVCRMAIVRDGRTLEFEIRLE